MSPKVDFGYTLLGYVVGGDLRLESGGSRDIDIASRLAPTGSGSDSRLCNRANKTPDAAGFNTQQAYFGFINGLELNQVHAFAPVNCTAL